MGQSQSVLCTVEESLGIFCAVLVVGKLLCILFTDSTDAQVSILFAFYVEGLDVRKSNAYHYLLEL